jgi:hypothetical protein
MALMLTGGAACDSGPSSTTGPQVPGSISVTTATSGFLQDDGYQVLVNGESKGAIGANDELMLVDVEPATYEVDLGDLASNCTVEGASATVVPEQTASVSLTVVCTHAAAESYTLQFGRQRPDLDTGNVTVCPFSICSTTEAWDFYVYDSFSSTPHSVIRQNQTNTVEIAHLPGVTLANLTEADYDGAVFTTSLVADPFDASRVILLRTDLGAVYALGNPDEDYTAGVLTFDAALLVAGS